MARLHRGDSADLERPLARRCTVWIVALLPLLAIPARSAASDMLPPFDLPRRPTGARVHSGDFAGQVLVLDFFASWCAPCEGVSKELETGIQQYYVSRGGNPQHLPVRVVSVNIEQERPSETDAFLQRSGASFVLDDFSGSLLRHFGEAGLPLIVVVDGSKGRADGRGFRVVYEHAGYEGSRRLRSIIDGLGDGAGASTASPTERTRRGLPVTQILELDTEVVWSGDVLLSESKLRYDYEQGTTQWDAAVGAATLDEDYRPFRQLDFFGFSEALHEEQFSGQANLRQHVSDAVTLLGTGSAGEGYKDYRRLWIANRYRQKYDNPAFPRIPGYRPPQPGQWNAGVGLRWEYLPTLGFAELRPSYAYERAAPGYEDGTNSVGDYKLIRGRENLDTFALTASSENVLSRRLRSLQEFTFAQTTGRNLRFSYQGSLNLAMGERWVWRGYGGISAEAPRFDACFFGLTAEYELLPYLWLSVTGRYYSDSGEIDSSLTITSAAPPLRVWEAGLGLRYTYQHFLLRLQAGPFETDYRRRAGIGQEFTYLYADRNWGLAQVACSLQF